MSDFQAVLKTLRQSKGLTQEELAKIIKVSRSSIGMYEKGSRQPDYETLEIFADYFNVDIDYLLGRSNKTTYIPKNGSPSPFGAYRIPVVATVAAGEPIYSDERITEWIDYHKDPKDSVFAVHVKGDSMMPRIHDGDTIVIEQDTGWNDGDIVLVTVNGNDGTCKRIKKYQDGIALISLNPAYEPMYYSAAEVQDLPIRIVGKVTQVRGEI